MAEPARSEGQPPPPLEQIHLPGPSYLPVTLAFGATVAIVGVVLSWVMFAIGLLIVIVTTIRWIRGAREEMAELPLEH